MFEPISPNLSLRDRIVQQILSKIEGGILKPGDRLPPERDLALELNVSRTTIRDALRTLVGLGVVSILHGKGIFVQGDEGMALGNALWAPFVVKPDTVSALFEVRKTLETTAAGLAAIRGTATQREQIVQIVKDSITEAKNGTDVDPEAAALADQTFHTRIFIASNNPVASRLMLNLLDLLEEVRKNSLAIPGRAWKSMLEHEKVARAVSEGNQKSAERAMLAHLTSVEESVLSVLTVH